MSCSLSRLCPINICSVLQYLNIFTPIVSGDKPKLYELQYFQFVNNNGQEEVINIIGATASHWKELGTALEFESYVLENIEENFGRVEKRCYELLRKWLVGNSKSITWETLLHAMLKIGCDDVAQPVWNSITDEGICMHCIVFLALFLFYLLC